MLPRLQGQIGGVKTLVHVTDGAAADGMVAFESLVDAQPEMVPIDKGGDELAGLF